MNRIRIAAVAVTALALFATGCGDSGDTASSKAESATFPATVKAGNGDVDVPKKPSRVVSLSPTATETLFAINAGTQTVAVDEQSNYPANAPKTDLSGYQPNAEAVIGYKPDLVVIQNDANGLLASLRTTGVPVLVEPSATTFDDTYDQIVDIGTATGHTADAEKVVGDIKWKVKNAGSRAPKSDKPLRYYHEVDNTFYSATSSTFIGQVYSLYGLQNIADAAAKDGNTYPQLSSEYIVTSNPDFIFLADTKCCAQDAQVVSQRPGWANIQAVKSNKVISLDDDIASRWGPRIGELVDSVGTAVSGSADLASK